MGLGNNANLFGGQDALQSSLVTSQIDALTRVADLWPTTVDIGTKGIQFKASRSGLHTVTITNATFFDMVLDEGCLSVGAYMESYGGVPIEIRPDATKAGKFLVCYVKVPKAGIIQINASKTLRTGSSKTVSPYTQGIKNVNMNLTCNHSTATTINPLTSFVHPSMVYIPGGWNGATYWMTATPWGDSSQYGAIPIDRYEDGCLFSGNDPNALVAVNVNASGFANITAAYALDTSVATDCRLAFDPNANSGAGVLYAYTRLTKSGVESLIRQQTTNGTTWTNLAGVTGQFDTLTFVAGSTLLHPLAASVTNVLSPSILFNGGEVRMWVTMQDKNLNVFLRHFVSLDGLSFSGGDILPSPWTEDYQGTWHTDIQYDDDARQYLMLGQLQKVGALGSVYTNVNILYTSIDGKNWAQQPVPAAYSGYDMLPLKSYQIYKGALCRTGIRKWIILNSVINAQSKFVGISGPINLESDKPRTCHASTSVFDEPQGRFYSNTSNILTNSIIQREPAWANVSNAGATVNILNGKLNLLRNGAQAAIATGGTRLGNQFRLIAKMKATHTTSIGRISAETGNSNGVAIEGNVSLLKLAQVGDAGVPYTNDTVSHIWEYRREQLSTSDPSAIVVTGSSNGTRTITATTTGFAIGTPIKLVGANVDGTDIDTICESVVNASSFTVPVNVPAKANLQVRATTWKLYAMRDGVQLHSITTSELVWGSLRFFCSGSADNQGFEIEWAYVLPFNTPDIKIL